ncbi:MAG: glutathione S-transferase N-terminal domain-containing protein, partial [Actinomycetota bacterium]|nr:glutathione S-transferase N-terminal domain-containing protein [Actinomycetota bacterium]
FTLPASHPGTSVELMLEFKGIEFRRVDLLPAVHRGLLKLAGFSGNTVPALRFNGEKFQHSVEIARGLDRLVPKPPLLPPEGDPRRDAVLEAENLGEATLQHLVRQIIWWLLRRDRSTLVTYMERAKLPAPKQVAAKTAGPLVIASARLNESTDGNVRARLAELPAILDRLDGWVEDGTIGGETPNAADFQIAPSILLAMTMEDLRPFIAARPIGAAARRIDPDFPGTLQPGLPAEWLAPLRAAAS